MYPSWTGNVQGLKRSLDNLQNEVERVSRLPIPVSAEWSTATKQAIDSLYRILFMANETGSASQEVKNELPAMLQRLNGIQKNYERLRV